MSITFTGAFGNMGNVSNTTGGSKGNDPKDGTGDFMLREVRKAESDNGSFRFLIDLMCVADSADGVYTKGEEIQVCIHKSKFDKLGEPTQHETDIKPWLLTLCGVKGDDDSVVILRGKEYFEETGQGEDYAKLDEIMQRAASWMGMSRMFTATDDNDKPTGEPGFFDGQAILRINFNTTQPRARKIQGSQDPMFDKEGNPVMTKARQYNNVRARIAMEDVVGDFDVGDIKMFFGSEENMAEILESEAEEFAELEAIAEASKA